MRKRLTLILTATAIAALALAGCSSDESPVGSAGQTPPELPSLATMKMNISLFESADLPEQSIAAGTLEGRPLVAEAEGSRLNFLNAAVRTLYLQVVVLSAMADPVAAFSLAVRSVPQPQDDGSWLWTYIVVDEEVEYSIYLFGKRESGYTAWRMEVSSTLPEMPLDRFLWFDGEVYDDESGYWQFYEPEEVPAALAAGPVSTPGMPSIRIDWTSCGARCGSLAFLVNKPGDPAEGSILVFDEGPDRCSIVFHGTEEGFDGTILWQRDGSGYIEWPDYHDGDRSCWDTLQRDIACAL